MCVYAPDDISLARFGTSPYVTDFHVIITRKLSNLVRNNIQYAQSLVTVDKTDPTALVKRAATKQSNIFNIPVKLFYSKLLLLFFPRVKVLTWKRIMIRHREDVPLDNWTEERTDSLRKFTGFHEAIFDTHGTRGNHMDLGQLYQFLSDRGCSNIFQMYFGIEGR